MVNKTGMYRGKKVAVQCHRMLVYGTRREAAEEFLRSETYKQWEKSVCSTLSVDVVQSRMCTCMKQATVRECACVPYAPSFVINSKHGMSNASCGIKCRVDARDAAIPNGKSRIWPHRSLCKVFRKFYAAARPNGLVLFFQTRPMLNLSSTAWHAAR